MEKLANLLYYAILIALAYFLFPFFLPFIFALIVVIMLEPLIVFLEKRWKLKRALAIIPTYSVFFLTVLTAAYFLIAKLVKETIDLTSKLPTMETTLTNGKGMLQSFYKNMPGELQTYTQDTITNLVNKLNDVVPMFAESMMTFVTEFPGYIIAFIVFFVSVYIIGMELPKLRAAMLRYFAAGPSRRSIEIVLDKLKKAIIGFLRAQIILSSLTFIICAIAIQIIGLPYVMFSSMLVVIIDLLPILGTGAALVPWSIYLFATGQNTAAIGILTLLTILTIFRRIMEPKLLADSLGISPLLTLVSMYIGFALIGFFGLIIGPAIIIVIKALEDAKIVKIRINFSRKNTDNPLGIHHTEE